MDKTETAELEAKWIEALTSGQYAQGEGKLHIMAMDDEPDKYCCLGVLCDVYDPSGWKKIDSTTAYAYVSKMNKEYPPSFIVDEAGLRQTTDRETSEMSNPVTNLTMLNDTYHLTFAEIAAVVRAGAHRWGTKRLMTWCRNQGFILKDLK